jgi:hypothetical protein
VFLHNESPTAVRLAAPRTLARAAACLGSIVLAIYLPRAAAQEAFPAAADASMAGFYGSYPMSREGSGTSWQPDSTPISGLQEMSGPWMHMVHGFANLIYDDQGGPRGATKIFSSSMLMFMARRELTDAALGVRLMVSADPLMGKSGYPLLFQTGETADGRTPLIRVRRAAGRTGTGTGNLHAPPFGYGQSGSPPRASLARLHPHQLGCGDRRLHLEAA